MNTDSGIATALSSAVSASQTDSVSGVTRSRLKYNQTAPAVMPSMATLIAKNAR